MSESAPSRQPVIRGLARDPWVVAGIGLNLAIALVYTVPLLHGAQMEYFSYYATTIVWLFLTVAAVVSGIFSVERRDERRFWYSIAVAYLCLAAGETVGSLDLIDAADHAGGTFLDCIYFLYYFGWIYALEANPHLDQDQIIMGRAREFSWAGRAFFVAGVYAYFVLLPQWFSPETYSVWMPSFLFYVGLDLYITGRLWHRWKSTRKPRWRFHYGLLGIAMLLASASEVLGTFLRAGWISVPTPSFADIRWFAPFFFIVIAARGRGLEFPARVSAAKTRAESTSQGAPLLVYAFAFPIIHFTLHSVGSASAELVFVREVFVLVWILFLAGLSYAQHRHIAARNRSLEIQRRASEAEIRALNAELEQRVADRTAQLTAANAELQTFAYSVSHDLRAPLLSIDGFSRALAEECADTMNRKGLSYLQRVRGAAQRMGHLIDGLLSLSRITMRDMSFETVDLSAMALSVAERLRESAPEREVEIEVEDGLEVPQADADLLGVVMDNLLGNAWKFTAAREGARIEVGEILDGNCSAYFVRDNGAGFDMAHAEKLFLAFERLHRSDEFEGDGIGLATVQRIIQRHGGKIWAEGRVGEGATFFFTLGQ